MSMKLQNIIHILIGIVCIGLLPTAQAVSPPPDGAYSGANTAEGGDALFHLTAGIDNTALGFATLWNDTTGSYNTAIGEQTLYLNISGMFNTASGYRALYNNAASRNTADGFGALYLNTLGTENTAMGFKALYSNTAGYVNTAVGAYALYQHATGSWNTAIGDSALKTNTFGEDNTAIGAEALRFSSGSNNAALGFQAGGSVTTADNVIVIGAQTLGANVSNSCFIGNIRGVQTANADAIPVQIDSAGQLGTQSSSRRFKSEIKPMDNASEAILSLNPVMFHYKSDKKNTPQFGLIAEEVAKVNPDLVVRYKNGEIYTVRYEQVNAMLLNEFLKEHKAFVAEQHNVEKLQAIAAQQQKQIEALTAGLQKVSAQLEVSKPAPQTVLNRQ
jgi:hypothetical protein